MNKKFTAFAFVLTFVFSFAISAFAVPAPPSSGSVAQERKYPLLVDDADLISEAEEKALLKKLEEISSRQKMDVAVISVVTLDSRNIQTYTEDFYDYYGYGQGKSKNGVMFLVSMSQRQAHMTAVGSAIAAFTDAGRDYILDEYVMPLIKEGSYAEAFDAFATQSDLFIAQAKTSEPFDVHNLPKGKFKRPDDVWLVAAIIAAALITALFSLKLKNQMKTVEFKTEASNYSVPGSLNVVNASDNFVTASVTRKQIRSDSGGSSGGSTPHTSSSGTTHSGTSRSF